MEDYFQADHQSWCALRLLRSRWRAPRQSGELCAESLRHADVPDASRSELEQSFSEFSLNLLKQDGISLDITDHYGAGLGESQKANFAPRLGFAYQVNPKLVVRGGFGVFYNGFENRGFSPNIGENYPFQFNFNYTPKVALNPGGTFDPLALYVFSNSTTTTVGTPCATAGPGGVGTFETGFSCTPLSPLPVNAIGLALRGIQFFYKTPYSMSGNLTVQYSIKPTLAVTVGYVTSQGRHIETFPGTNNPLSIGAANASSLSLSLTRTSGRIIATLQRKGTASTKVYRRSSKSGLRAV